MDQIRIIKEMRDKDAKSGRTGADIRPRFMVWENVPNVYSINDGKDFAAVLEETIRVVEPNAPDIHVPRGGWTLSGAYVGRGWSVAWRVLDAQFWGVPQRRRRIALIADFGGQSAPEILFKSNSLHGHLKQSETQRQGTSGDATDSTGTASGFPLGFRPENVSMYDETATTLCNGTRPEFTCGVCYVKTTKPHSKDEAPTIEQSDVSPTLNQLDTGDTRSNTFVVERGETE
jgi:site-specific DNA-cytosine methylase